MVAVKRKLSEKRLFDSLKSDNSDKSDDDPIVKPEENTSDDEVDEILSEQDDESDDDATESQESDNKECEKSQNVTNEECDDIKTEHNNLSESQISDSDSVIENIDSVQHLDDPGAGAESHSDSSLSENVITPNKQ